MQKIKNKSIKAISLLLLCVLLYGISRKGLPNSEIVDSLRLGAVVYYMPFFLLGIVAKMYFDFFSVLTENKMFQFLIFFTTVSSFVFPIIPLIVKSISVIFLLYFLSKKLTERTDVPIGLKYFVGLLTHFGRNSIEIYFLHFALLFRLPHWYDNYFNRLFSDSCWWGHSSASFFELLVFGFLAIIISYVSILFAYVLKQIPYVSLLLFGKNEVN